MLILAAILAIFVYGMIAAMLGTILPDLSQRFKFTPKQNGTIAFCQALGLILASLSVGPLLDNEGNKVGLVLGLGLITLSLLLLPRSTGFSTVAFYLFLLGVGGGIIVVAANKLAYEINPDNSGTNLLLVNLFFGLGGLATPFISANLLKRNSMYLLYTVAAFTGIALLVNVATPMPGPTGAKHFVFSQVGSLLGATELWLLCFFLFLYVASEVGVWNWLAQHLIAQGIPESRALNILSLGFALGILVGRVGVSQVLKSYKDLDLTVTLVASICMAIFTFLMLKTRNATAAGVLVFLAGVAMAPVFPTTLSIVGHAFESMKGTATGIVVTFGWIGLAVSSRIIGQIAGGDPKRLKKALLLLPGMAVLMIAVNLALHAIR